jgi:hypothetical protein
MNVNGGYSTKARVLIYNFKELDCNVRWFDTYRQALDFSKSFKGDSNIVVGTVDVIEVVA